MPAVRKPPEFFARIQVNMYAGGVITAAYNETRLVSQIDKMFFALMQYPCNSVYLRVQKEILKAAVYTIHERIPAVGNCW